VTLSAPGVDAFANDIATSTRGDAVVVWDQVPTGDTPTEVLAAYRVEYGAFGPPELIAESAFAGTPQVAFDPITKRPSVVWRSRDLDGPGIPLADVKTYARFASRVPQG
jgi:hypothetical protein